VEPLAIRGDVRRDLPAFLEGFSRGYFLRCV